MKRVKKAIFPIAGLGTRFLPQSKAIPKELLPLGDKPLIHYAVEEAVLSQIEKILFIQRKGQKGAFEYFKRNKALEEILEEENKEKELLALKEIENLANNVLITAKTQRKPIGIASAIYQARDFAFKEPCAVCFSDDIIDSKVPCLEQLQEIFSTCESPVLALKKVSPDRISSYGIVKVEKIANRFYKIKGTSEKPKLEDAPSNLAIVGRMILTEDVFDFLGKNREMTAKNVSISVALGEMAELGKAIYGYEIEGNWLECGDITSWYKSFVSTISKEKL